eukprot:COSAG01_NODE_55492_length_324_cov_1.840000_1_plen_30_part_10
MFNKSDVVAALKQAPSGQAVAFVRPPSGPH